MILCDSAENTPCNLKNKGICERQQYDAHMQEYLMRTVFALGIVFFSLLIFVSWL